MSLAKQADAHITEEEYLQGELISETKHEYIGGDVYAMVGASTTHNLISSNILSELKNDLKQKKSPCDVFSSDMKVKICDVATSFFYPDVMVVCENNDNDDYYQNNPVIIVEVLSKSTRKKDLSSKRLCYFNIPSLEEYVVIEQDICQVIVFRKNDGWKSSFYFLGDEIRFDSIATALFVEDIYYHVDNNDMLNFLKEREELKEIAEKNN